MNTNSIKIKDLPKVLRPRERLIKDGPFKLSNVELLAILLSTGKKGENVLELAKRILRQFNHKKITDSNFVELKMINGLGPAKASLLLSAFELSRRLLQNQQPALILSPKDVWEQLKDIRDNKKENFVIFFLDARNREIKREIISVGSLNANLVHPREVFEPAIKYLSAQLIAAHNHLSGDIEPSQEDIAITKRLVNAGNILGIELLDHVIVTKESFYSFKENNLI
jgi:DNA repair protein RadC